MKCVLICKLDRSSVKNIICAHKIILVVLVDVEKELEGEPAEVVAGRIHGEEGRGAFPTQDMVSCGLKNEEKAK